MGISLSIAKQLNDFHLEVQFQSERRVIGFLGTSGSGKSITLRAIAGLMIPDHGRIVIGSKVFFDSKEGINLAPQARKTGFLFQNYALFPNMTKILGYKNISQFENVRQRHTVYAAQWGCRLETDRKQVIPERGYLGIKGHDLSLADRPGESNTFPCWVTQVVETPQTATLFLTLNRPPQHSEDYHIQLEMDRENHQSLAARPYPWYVHIDPKKIFYVNG